ncbi:HD domain-containing protein [Clostridium cochlearium]|uniref:HD domain-containing protein n=1 Tax=Clostridium cochlearium TaxID=1494 RepID=A0A7Y3V7S3_CLOCO|nr:HD domain-containing protein [Clostridium cochlearium]NOH15407.1 HD domain-containing protein [Clostridium cochlearium]
MKDLFIKDIEPGKKIKGSFMIMKILYKDENNRTIMYIGDNTGELKASIIEGDYELQKGDVIECEAVFETILKVESFSKQDEFKLEDYLPSVKRPIEDILKEIEDISKEEFKSEEIIILDRYFFRNNNFLYKFKRGTGGARQHHNYIGGLAEHTLNVMYMAKILAYRYNCRNKEIAILGAKLHDIGKTEEYFVEGPFSYTLRGEMEGHIVIGVTMLEEAFREKPELYSEEFKNRMKGCIVQHHGKMEYGSPKTPNTEEAYIVHYADYVDATMNKVAQIKEGLDPNTWSDYDRRIAGKLYI